MQSKITSFWHRLQVKPYPYCSHSKIRHQAAVSLPHSTMKFLAKELLKTLFRAFDDYEGIELQWNQVINLIFVPAKESDDGISTNHCFNHSVGHLPPIQKMQPF
ncbi:hypothetical protein ACSBR2_039998 [Camellia fascicularis]